MIAAAITNRPLFPPSVLVFGSDEEFVDKMKNFDICTGDLTGIKGHFSEQRWALLFKPNKQPYRQPVKVGYYVQVLGLGSDSSQVVFEGNGRETGVYCPNFGGYDGGMLNTFWRSAENLTTSGGIDANGKSWPMVWGVSQAAPIRNITCPYGLSLYADPYSTAISSPDSKQAKDGTITTTFTTTTIFPDYSDTYPRCNLSSGGFAANITVTGTLNQGSQQQFCFRNVTTTEGFTGGAWSMVYIGCDGAVDGVGSISVKPPMYTNTDIPIPMTHTPGVVSDTDIGETGSYGFNTLLDDDSHSHSPSFYGQFVRVDKTPVIAEKPFISYSQTDDGYVLNVPQTQLNGSFAQYPSLRTPRKGSTRPFNTDVYVTWPIDYFGYNKDPRTLPPSLAPVPRDTAETMQQALDAGRDLLITPGIYYLETPLIVRFDDQVILCIGMATLIAPRNGSPCVRVPKGLKGVRLAGLFLEATVLEPEKFDGSTLLHWGWDSTDFSSAAAAASTQASPASASDPSGYIYDLFCRVGGSNTDPRVGVDIIAQIDSDWVVGDNLWLWRADHSAMKPVNMADISANFYQTTISEYPCNIGLKVTGSNVYMYGLASEHMKQDNVLWLGTGGRTYFFQNELPYDATSEFGTRGYAAYKVVGSKQHDDGGSFSHTAYACGVYCNYRDHEVHTPSGIVAVGGNNTGKNDATTKINFINAFTVYLPSTTPFWGAKSSSIHNVINDLGGPAGRPGQKGHIERFPLPIVE